MTPESRCRPLLNARGSNGPRTCWAGNGRRLQDFASRAGDATMTAWQPMSKCTAPSADEVSTSGSTPAPRMPRPHWPRSSSDESAQTMPATSGSSGIRSTDGTRTRRHAAPTRGQCPRGSGGKQLCCAAAIAPTSTGSNPDGDRPASALVAGAARPMPAVAPPAGPGRAGAARSRAALMMAS